jgi:acetyltransferase
MSSESLTPLLRSKSIAIIGASNTPGKIGYLVLKNLVDGKYPGQIYAINSRECGDVLGIRCYRSVLDVPGEIDAAMLVVPAARTLAVAEECGHKGVKALIVVASGYSEIGRTDLETDLVTVARRYGMRVLGPNIVGIMSNSDHTHASFAPFMPLPGRAALVSQSGALVIAMSAASHVRNVGFDKMISVGNMADVNFDDLVRWLDEDDQTTSIAIYVEGFKNGRLFLETAQRVHKPIVVLKAGISAHGSVAAQSHTGAMAGTGKIYEAAFQQAGVVRASDLTNLFDRTLALSLQPPMSGDNLMVISNGGGVGVLATDAAERCGIPLHFAPKDLQASLRAYLPEIGTAMNPVDLTGMGGSPEYFATVRTALQHPWVHGLVVLFCDVGRDDPMEIAATIKRAMDDSAVVDKPVTLSFIGGAETERAIRWLVGQGVPTYGAPDTAINGIAALHEYAHNATLAAEVFTRYSDVDEAAARAIMGQARTAGRLHLTEVESKLVFAAYGLPVVATDLATTEDEAVRLAEKRGYPVVLKITSHDILHKSDAGGVKVNLNSAADVKAAYRTILASAQAYKADARIEGIAVQQMVPSGVEVILGSVNDPAFGPTMMVGLGGIFTEILQDVTYRVAPISPGHAQVMLEELQGAPILTGIRGAAPCDRTALATTVSRYSQMIIDLSDEIAESDANPVLVYAEGRGLKVVDARIILNRLWTRGDSIALEEEVAQERK